MSKMFDPHNDTEHIIYNNDDVKTVSTELNKEEARILCFIWMVLSESAQ